MGDILITSKTGVDGVASMPFLPSFPSGISQIPLSNKPVDLKQKVYFIADNLAVAFSGTENIIYQFLVSMNLFRNTRVTYKDLMDFIGWNGQRFENRSFSALIVHFDYPSEGERIAKTNIVIHVIGIGDFRKESYRTFRDVYASGSGAQQFLKGVNEASAVPVSYLFVNKENDPTYVRFITSVRANLKLITDFVTREAVNAENLFGRWGAGFEMAYIHPEDLCFRKLDNYTMIIWKAWFSDGKLVIEPHLMMKHIYHKDYLIIWSTDIINTSVVFPVRRIDQEPFDYSDLPDLSFESPLICYSVVLFVNNEISILTSAFDVDVKPPWITIKNEQGRWIPRLSNKERKRIEKEARNILNKRR